MAAVVEPDVIVCWPANCDYPLWRKFARDQRFRFGRLFVVFTPALGGDQSRDISGFVRGNLEAEFLEIGRNDQRDWRDNAVNLALDHSASEWVWFTEQDFLIRNPPLFWATVARGMHGRDLVGLREPDSRRWHPACLFARREAIDATDRNFAPGDQGEDHFYRFGRQFEATYDLVTQGALEDGEDFEHLAGTSQNHFLLDRALGFDGIYRRERFRAYLRDSLAVDVPLEPGWAEAARREVSGG